MEWRRSFTFGKQNSCIKILKRIRVKLTHENNLFYIPCSVPEIKMSFNSVKIDSVRSGADNWVILIEWMLSGKHPMQWGNSMIYAMFALANITETKLSRVAKTQAKETLERLSTDVMGPSESRLTIKVPVLHSVCGPVRSLRLWTCLRQRVKHWSAWEAFTHYGNAQEADARQCEGVSLRRFQDVLVRCKHSTGENPIGDATTQWVNWMVQQDTVRDD